MNTQGLIFDLDGLLLDTERVSRSCWLQLGEQYGYNIEEIYPELIGKGTIRGDEMLLEHFGPSFPMRRLRKEKNALFKQALDEGSIPLKEGAREALLAAQRAGKRIALATGSTEEEAKQKLRPFDLLEMFEATAFSNEVANGKPAPDLFLLAAKRLSLTAEECLVLEDSYSGVDAACAAGMKVIFIPDLVSPQDWPADQVTVFDSLYEVANHLEAWSNGDVE